LATKIENNRQPEQLLLFDLGGIDMAKLRAMRDGLQAVNKADLTVRGYAADWRMFDGWCQRTGRNPLPATEETLGLYVAWLVGERERKVSTATRHMAAIAHYHLAANLAKPGTADANRTLHGVRRSRNERPQGKLALRPSELARAAKACDPKTNRGARNRAAIVLGFATSLRRSSLADLQLSDIAFEREGVAIYVRKEKQDQLGKGRVIGVWNGERPETDPPRVLRAWIARRGTWQGPLFPRVHLNDTVLREQLSGEAFHKIVQACLKRIGIEPKFYGAHSLRAGAVTAAAQLGRSDQEIMGLSGHTTPAVMKQYVRRARIFDGRNPLAGVL
jgi:integrase